MTEQKKSRLLVFVVAYNAERTLETVLSRIPPSLADDYEVEILAIDDASADRTFEIGQEIKTARSLSFPLRVLLIRSTRVMAAIKRSDIITRLKIISISLRCFMAMGNTRRRCCRNY